MGERTKTELEGGSAIWSQSDHGQSCVRKWWWRKLDGASNTESLSSRTLEEGLVRDVALACLRESMTSAVVSGWKGRVVEKRQLVIENSVEVGLEEGWEGCGVSTHSIICLQAAKYQDRYRWQESCRGGSSGSGFVVLGSEWKVLHGPGNLLLNYNLFLALSNHIFSKDSDEDIKVLLEIMINTIQQSDVSSHLM